MESCGDDDGTEVGLRRNWIRHGNHWHDLQPENALTKQQISKGVERIQRGIADLRSFDVESISRRHDSAMEMLEISIQTALAKTFGHGTVEYKRYASATSLDTGPTGLLTRCEPPSIFEIRRFVTEGIGNAIAILEQAVKGLEENLQHDDVAPVTEIAGQSTKVFIVHGRDEALKQTVARFLTQIGLEPVILHELRDSRSIGTRLWPNSTF